MSKSNKIRVFVTGTRGIPDIPGGVESHCQQLYPLIAEKDVEIKLARRTPYLNESSQLTEYKTIQLIDISTTRKKSLEAIIHTFKSLLAAKKWGADIVHIHAIGPALLTPIARLMGLKVVFTHHGPDYDRDKWGKMAKFVLQLGEKLGGLFANEIIVISTVINDIIYKRCNRHGNLIYNGVKIPEIEKNTEYLQELGVEPGKYILAVARFVPEKGLHDLINAFNQSATDHKLVIAGDADHEDDYSIQLKEMAEQNNNIILTGYITGNPLKQLYSHAKLFILPSYHEGLPIVLLEALSYGLTVLVSDIPANLEVKLDKKYYFETKNIKQLAEKIVALLNEDIDQNKKLEQIEWVREKYNWKTIAQQTIDVYQKVAGNKKAD